MRKECRIGFSGNRGFTLFELLLVLALVSISLALVSIPAGSGSLRSKEKIAARTVASAMKLARARAISERQIYYVSDLGGLLLKSSGGYEKKIALPEGTKVSPLSMAFYPTGRASGGEAAVGSGKEGGRFYIVKVDPSSGWVSLKEGGTGRE